MKLSPKVVALGALAFFLSRQKKEARPVEPEPEPEPACEPCNLGPFNEEEMDLVWTVSDELDAAIEQDLLLTHAQREGEEEIADFFEARANPHPVLGRRISYPEWLAASSFWFHLKAPEHVWECCFMSGEWELNRVDLVSALRNFATADYWEQLQERAIEVGDPEPSLASLQGPP